MLLTVARVQHRRTLGAYMTFGALAVWLVGSLISVCLIQTTVGILPLSTPWKSHVGMQMFRNLDLS